MNSGPAAARTRLAGLTLAILLAFGVVAAAVAYWTMVRGPSMLERNDNPRLVEAELRIQRGTIVDVNGQPLAITSGSDGDLRRDYPLPSAAPAVGYYSFRHGTAGVEEAFDQLLRGEPADFWTGFWQHDTLGQPLTGSDVRLTIDSRWQDEASDLLADRSGAVLLFSLPDVAIRAMASRPGYDPSNLEADFERLAADQQSPLLNRVTQGQYQPGLLLQPFLLAAAQRDGLVDLREAADGAAAEVMVDGVSLSCQGEHTDSMSWSESLNARCPGPMATLGEEMGDVALLSALESFGLTSPPQIAIAAAAAEELEVVDTGLAAIGQDVATVSPLQVGIALAALANGGQVNPPQLIAATQDVQGQWLTTDRPAPGNQVVPDRVASGILDAFSRHEGVLEHDVIVLSGPAGEFNSWYLGLAPAENPRYGVVVVVEDDQGLSTASQIGRVLLKSVLDPDQS